MDLSVFRRDHMDLSRAACVAFGYVLRKRFEVLRGRDARVEGLSEFDADYTDNKVLPVGTKIFHCGSPGGQDVSGTGALFAGIICRTGVPIPTFGGSEYLFDHIDCAGLPGSSGGMVCLQSDARWVGMITLGLRAETKTDNFHWLVPVRSVREWAKEINAEWILDPNAVVTDDMLQALPLENSRAGFVSGVTRGRPTPSSTTFNTMEMGADAFHVKQE